jgi:GDP/UDP-N,N'-diacetylbacillosamine 2-epimerase (hydrolysing)
MKICVATGTRAEYGLLKPLIDKIKLVKEWQLQLLVTASHLSPEFGLTYKQIENDGLNIDAKVEMLLSSDTAEGVVKSMGLGMIGFADALKVLQPDLIVILGDRYEMLALASAALIYKIPVAHISGGETTEGAYDDSIRHSITKMSHLHFTSTEDYSKRVIQLGENPSNVYTVGALGLDNTLSSNLLSKKEVEDELQISFKKYNYLVAFHPETLAKESSESQFRILLNALDRQDDSFFVFTKANADTDGRIINQMMKEYVLKNKEKAVMFPSLGSQLFLSVMKIVNAVVGNSSSGIVEAPSLHTPTINIGNRQKGRIQSDAVLNAEMNVDDISSCFEKIKSRDFQDAVKNASNPYGGGKATDKIVEALKSVNMASFQTKLFYDL